MNCFEIPKTGKLHPLMYKELTIQYQLGHNHLPYCVCTMYYRMTSLKQLIKIGKQHLVLTYCDNSNF